VFYPIDYPLVLVNTLTNNKSVRGSGRTLN
jgi:hypothetical protein